MKRLVIVIFVIVAAALGILFFMGDSKDTGAASVTRSQTVIPKSATQQQDTPEIQAQDEVDDSLVSLIPLRNDEILMGILGIDFDGDGYDDQINTIRSMTSPYIKIIVGLYNPYKGQYERSAIIDTEIIQTRTFSYTCMDIIGNHRNVLSYSGFLEDGNSVMKLFLPEKRDTGLVMNVIGDFRSDGTIFIQQMDRHESYLSQKANGVSYPVWVYRSDNSQGENSLDQIQTRYIWDIASGKYVKDTETRVRETKVSTRELNKTEPWLPSRSIWMVCGSAATPSSLYSSIPGRRKSFSKPATPRRSTPGSAAPCGGTASISPPSTAPSTTLPAVLTSPSPPAMKFKFETRTMFS